MHIHGSCHCGAIRFTADIDPERVTLCHCSDCQTLSGAPMRAIVRAPIDQFQLQGNPKAYVKTAQSGQRRAQVFCPECGTPLYGSEAVNPQYVVIRLGCVAERAGLPPRKQLWTRSAMPWIHDLENVPAFAEGS